MCFKAKSPKIKEPAPPPSEREGAIEGVQERQRQAAAAANSGFTSTVGTSPMGVTERTDSAKPTLGAA